MSKWKIIHRFSPFFSDLIFFEKKRKGYVLHCLSWKRNTSLFNEEKKFFLTSLPTYFNIRKKKEGKRGAGFLLGKSKKNVFWYGENGVHTDANEWTAINYSNAGLILIYGLSEGNFKILLCLSLSDNEIGVFHTRVLLRFPTGPIFLNRYPLNIL